MVGPSWLGGLFNRSNDKRDKFLAYPYSPLQEQRLQRLLKRLLVLYDEFGFDHHETLKSLWYAAFPDTPLKGMISEQWKEMGWQGANPSTDFRLCGFISLQNLLFCSAKPRCLPAVNFVRMLGGSSTNYKSIIGERERELCLEDIKRITDVPAYDMLY